jgi:hypothetical protein
VLVDADTGTEIGERLLRIHSRSQRRPIAKLFCGPGYRSDGESAVLAIQN